MANNSRMDNQWTMDGSNEMKDIDDEETKVPIPINNIVGGA